MKPSVSGLRAVCGIGDEVSRTRGFGPAFSTRRVSWLFWRKYAFGWENFKLAFLDRVGLLDLEWRWQQHLHPLVYCECVEMCRSMCMWYSSYSISAPLLSKLLAFCALALNDNVRLSIRQTGPRLHFAT